MKSFIQVRDLYRVYTMGQERVYALKGINLDIRQNEVLCLLGTSGSGKSTLLNMMAGLDRPSKGEILVNGKIHMEKLSEAQLAKFRQLNVGFVFQSYNLIPTLTALENVSLGLIFKGVPKKEREEASRDILEKVGLGDRLHHKPKEMSGGQQQRVSIARAFVDSPPILFADEPTGNLDTATSIEVMDLMTDMARKHQQTLIIVTHDQETADYADRTVEMRDGQIIRDETKTPPPSQNPSQEDHKKDTHCLKEEL
ncbi:MAG: ABC transporter ATP-binding protein [Tissierellia bacterium]|nr:ABC transporter ATP-binding protein [Tissierellia bacterium]